MKLSNRIELPAELDNFFDQMFGHSRTAQRGFTPRTNIVEREKTYDLTLELPGVDVADVAVEVSEGRLSISGEKKIESIDNGKDVGDENAKDDAMYHRAERVHGKFERHFEFPLQVDFDKIEATSANGVLTIVVPKSEKVLPRRIEIN